MLDLSKKKENEMPWGGYDFSKKSLAVVAANKKGDGVVLWTVGAYVRMEMEEAGLTSLDELGIAPDYQGIWIWEGSYVWSPGGFEHPEDGEMDPVGTHRPPTEEEWACIRKGECPWNNADWRLPEYRHLEEEEEKED